MHLEESDGLTAYSTIEMEFAERLVETRDVSSLPSNWREPVAPAALQQLGDAWVISRVSVVLRVPSVIVPIEHNYLLNPLHPDFSLLRFGSPQPFDLDSRLRI